MRCLLVLLFLCTKAMSGPLYKCSLSNGNILFTNINSDHVIFEDEKFVITDRFRNGFHAVHDSTKMTCNTSVGEKVVNKSKATAINKSVKNNTSNKGIDGIDGKEAYFVFEKALTLKKNDFEKKTHYELRLKEGINKAVNNNIGRKFNISIKIDSKYYDADQEEWVIPVFPSVSSLGQMTSYYETKTIDRDLNLKRLLDVIDFHNYGLSMIHEQGGQRFETWTNKNISVKERFYYVIDPVINNAEVKIDKVDYMFYLHVPMDISKAEKLSKHGVVIIEFTSIFPYIGIRNDYFDKDFIDEKFTTGVSYRFLICSINKIYFSPFSETPIYLRQ